jgi:hypothetical protein
MALDKDEQWHIFGSLGEQTVRERIAQGVFGEERQRLAEEWLREQEKTRSNGASSRREVSTAEHFRIARSARTAAWIAAAAPIVAALSAAIAIILSLRRH